MKPKTNYKPGPMDNCQTPAYAVEPLIPYLQAGHEYSIWESAVGEGYLSAALRRAGYFVLGTDVQGGYDFFEWSPQPRDHYIQVTNPPYALKYRWLERSYELGYPFALLLPVETLGAKQAQRLFRESAPEIILLDHRVNFKMPEKGWRSSAQFPVCWITHGLGIGCQLTFAHIDNKGAK